MSTSLPSFQVSLLNHLHFAYGIRHPTWIVELSSPYPTADALARVARNISDILSVSPPPLKDFSEIFFFILSDLMKKPGFFVFSKPVLLESKKKSTQQSGIWAIPCPVVEPSVFTQAISICLAICNISYLETLEHRRLHKIREIVGDFLAYAGKFSISGSNTIRFMAAAADLNIPFTIEFSKFLTLGYGRNRIRFDSSITPQTNGTAIRLAGNKLLSSSIYRNLGFPVPKNRRTITYEEAEEYAKKLGYPVVIKPFDKDGGIGVSANIRNNEELRLAWNRASQHSSAIMVEQHVIGDDYRVIVMDGEVLWIVKRVPAGITGDGKRSVKQLIDHENLDPRRGTNSQSTLRPIIIDSETSELLKASSYSLESVIPEGEWIQLKRAANISSGGKPEVVECPIHPDNSALFIDCAKSIQLDLAGIDVISKNLAISWMAGGTHIIEINAKPQLMASTQSHLYRKIISKRIERNGRIPIFLALGELTHNLIKNQANCSPIDSRIAFNMHDGIYFGSKKTYNSTGTSQGDIYALLANPNTDGICALLRSAEITEHGLPFDEFDYLIIHNDEPENDLSDAALKLILPHCKGGVVIIAPLPEEKSTPRVESAVTTTYLEEQMIFDFISSKFKGAPGE